jgi:hypothetical protein
MERIVFQNGPGKLVVPLKGSSCHWLHMKLMQLDKFHAETVVVKAKHALSSYPAIHW